MDALDVIVKAKEKCRSLLALTPQFFPLQTIAEQLLYLEDALRNVSADRTKLKDINVGLFAVREFETRSPEFAEMLYEVEEVVEEMKSGRA